MPVPSSISDLSSTASSNYPSGSESIGTSLDDYLRAHASIIKQVSDANADASHTQAASTISDSTAAGRSLLTAADAAAQRTALGLVIGTNVQAYDADIPTVAASQVEMEAGTETALRSMSPLRVAQAIAVLTKNPVFDTAKASTSGTSIDFTGIPSWAKRITVMFNSVSTNGSSKLIVQLGSTSFETTGYTGSSGAANNSTGFGLDDIANSAAVRMGMCFLVNISGNVWVQSGSMGRSDSAASYSSGGVKTLSGVLDRVRITTANGTDAFDAGSINIIYE